MAIEIKRADSLSDAECEHLFGWGEDIFGSNSYNLQWRFKDVHFLLHEDEKLVSHVGVLKHTVFLGEMPVAVAGIGGVVTIPAAQKKGYAGKLMMHAADFINQWEVSAGMLFCLPHMVAFYAALGWQTVESPVFVEQPGGVIESPLHVMVMPCRDYQWQTGAVELKSLPW